MRAYFREYMEGGVERLNQLGYKGPVSELHAHRGSLEDEFREAPALSLRDAAERIKQRTSIERSLPQVRTFLLSTGIRCRKVGVVPAKADPEKQAQWKQEELDPRLEEAKQGKRTVFFVDGAHFVLSAFLGFVWSFTRIFLRSPSGRQRLSVLGAINAITHELITLSTTAYINAPMVCELLEKIRKAVPTGPITLVLDNARYQHCKLVEVTATALGIHLLFLPPYSPNLNLIERLWKFVKKEVLYSKYYEKFPAFQQAILSCLDKTQTEYRKEIASLMTLRFQSLQGVPFYP